MHCHCFVPRTTDTDEHFVVYKVHQTKTETLYYTGNILKKSCYLNGPKFLSNADYSVKPDLLTITLPSEIQSVNAFSTSIMKEKTDFFQLLKIERISSFKTLLGIYSKVFLFINKLKSKLKNKNPDKFVHLKLYSDKMPYIYCIKNEQNKEYSEIYDYFATEKTNFRDMPSLIQQLNVFIDVDGLLRVGGKMDRNKSKIKYSPILLPKKNYLTRLIILHTHEKLQHSGVYSVLGELRKTFWVPHCFSTVKTILKGCVFCRRFNSRTVKLNQSPYKEFRLEPGEIPFSNIFLDYLGPFFVKINSIKTKIWILCVTCLYTRAINLQISVGLSNEEF